MVDGEPASPARPGGRRLVGGLLVGVGVLVLLGALLLGAGGFYYAGQIRSEALAPHVAGAPRYDLVVTVADGDRVVLRRTGPIPVPDPVASNDVYGLLWPGGNGVLSGEPAIQERQISRVLRVTGGTPPTPGTPAALRTEVWDDPRAAYGVAYQEVAYPCAGGSCPAWFVPGVSSTWLVAVHGKGGGRSEPLRGMRPALEAGLPILDIGYRNDPDAPADPSGRYGYGATEWRDLEQAVGYAVDHGAQHVVLLGYSMGGGIVAAFLERSPSAARVTGVVLDSPMLDLRATVDHGAAHRRLPVLGTGIPGVLTETAQRIAGWRFDLDWDAVDYLPGDWLHVPALVFHGTADETVPIATSDRLRAAHPDLVDEVRVPGAGHTQSWNVDRRGYETREAAFLSCVTAPEATAPCAVG